MQTRTHVEKTDSNSFTLLIFQGGSSRLYFDIFRTYNMQGPLM